MIFKEFWEKRNMNGSSWDNLMHIAEKSGHIAIIPVMFLMEQRKVLGPRSQDSPRRRASRGSYGNAKIKLKARGIPG